MTNDKYAEYALLDAQIKELNNKKDSLKVEILQDMVTNGIETTTNTVGKFTVSKLKSWEYPEAIVKLEDSLKAKKAKAQKTGEATYTESESLRFTPVKI